MTTDNKPPTAQLLRNLADIIDRDEAILREALRICEQIACIDANTPDRSVIDHALTVAEQARKLRATGQKKLRCPVFIGGEQCGREFGHEGNHVWLRGD